jgi:2-keto-4-pentenoate hydratase/2-oxohepta-3-ene-1,7-dioic acid hydratase in catechol pathway
LKLLTFSTTQHPTPRVGVLMDDGTLLDVGAAAQHSRLRLAFDPSDMISLAASGKRGLDQLRLLADAQAHGLPQAQEVHIHAPIPRPRKNVFCVGWNYLEHFEEGERIRQSGQELPKHPVFFTKAPTAVNGPFGDIYCDPALSDKFDWEVELGVVIGEGGKSINEQAAMAHIFGYTVVNDISVRDVQRAHGGQWFKGKSFDGTCPMGPYLVTADGVDPNALQVSCRVNGVTKQNSNTRFMYFKIPRLIAELSRGMTLEAGDIISTGTPEGVGFARNPPEFLKPGDIVETEIAGLGVMRNRMVV